MTSPAENGGSNGGKAGQHTQTAFRTLKRTNRPPEDGKPRGHTIEKGDNERQPNWQKLNQGQLHNQWTKHQAESWESRG